MRIGVPGFLRGGRGLRADIVIGLTPLGKTKAEQFSLQGPEFEVITDVEDSGPSSLSEIAGRTKLTEGKVRAIARNLIHKGYAMKMGSEDR